MIKEIAVVLPAYNEALTIKETILAFSKELPQAKIVVVDNNSKDDTAQIAQSTLEEYSINGIVLFEDIQGKANAIRHAFNVIDADIYIMSDADMTYPASQVHRLIEPIRKYHYDMVVGDRDINGAYKKENKRSFHNFGNNLVKTMVNKLFHANLSDIMSGYRAFSRKFVKNYPILVEGFELETEMTLHALDKKFKIKEVLIDYQDRPEGSESKLNTFRDGFKVLWTIFTIFRHYKPLMFFGFLSLFFILLSIISGMPVFYDWFTYKYIYHVPLAILATGFAVLSMIFLSLGLILDSIAYQSRLAFEQRANKD